MEIGSWADWFAAGGTIFAAITALRLARRVGPECDLALQIAGNKLWISCANRSNHPFALDSVDFVIGHGPEAEPAWATMHAHHGLPCVVPAGGSWKTSIHLDPAPKQLQNRLFDLWHKTEPGFRNLYLVANQDSPSQHFIRVNGDLLLALVKGSPLRRLLNDA